MRIKGEKFLVAGIGKTGFALCRFLARRGAAVTATDIKPAAAIACAAELKNLGVKIEAGGHRKSSFANARRLILSPGVSPDAAPVRAAADAGAEIMGDIDFAFRLCRLPVAAITGSNGKTTTTSLIAHILTACGMRPFVGGNIGDPFINAAGQEKKYDIALLEVSSFQLRTAGKFKPFIAVMLNISPNHLDVHPTYQDYAASKKNIFANQTTDDWAVANGADAQALAMLDGVRAKTVIFDRSSARSGPNRVGAKGGIVSFMGERYDLRGMKLQGAHNLENAMAAVAVASILGCDPVKIAGAARDFSPLPHRMEFVCEISGARVYNDSKATSPAATLRALESLRAPVVLICGGRDKKIGYGILRDEVRRKVSLLVIFGQSRRAICDELRGLAETTVASSLEDAVADAVTSVPRGGSILFSPACSSFDMFSSFEERGEEFKKIVRNFK